MNLHPNKSVCCSDLTFFGHFKKFGVSHEGYRLARIRYHFFGYIASSLSGREAFEVENRTVECFCPEKTSYIFIHLPTYSFERSTEGEERGG